MKCDRDIETKTIRELCELVVDCPHSTPTWTSQGKIVVRNNNIKNGRIDLSSPSYTDEEHYKQRTKRAVPRPGDIIITREAPIGEVGMIPDGVECCLGQRMVLLRPNPDICNNYYLLYSLQSRFVQHQISWSEGTGTTVSNLRIPHLEQIKIPYLPLEEQEKIASTLRVLDEKINLNRGINANLQQQAQAIFKSWFVDFEPFQDGEFVESELGPIPKGWKVISLENVCSVITKGTTPTTLKRRFTDCGINYIKAESISNAHFIDKNKIAYIDQETHELLSRSKIQENDILFTIAGTLGRFCMVDKENVPANTNQAVAIIRADISKIHPCVLYSYFLGDWHTEYCHTRVQQAVQANLSLGTLKNMQIPYPDEVTMEKYRSIVEPLIAEVQRTNRENVALENLRNALIPKLMNGEIDVEGVAD